MSLLDRSDLKYEYIWSTEPAIKPRSDARTGNESKLNIFRPDEGDKVLSFLNEYAQSREISEKEEAKQLETLLHDKLGKEGKLTKEQANKWLDEKRKQ